MSTRWIPLPILFLWLSSPLSADAIVVTRAMQASTIAEVFVEERGIRAELEIGVPDLPAFADLLPESLRERLGLDPEPLEPRLRKFFQEQWIVRADGGAPLIGRVQAMTGRPRVRRDEITGEPLPEGDEESETVVFVRIDYPLDSRPATLGFSAPLRPGTAASVGFVAYHRGLPVNDFRYLAGEETLTLDWSDPWYSRFDNRNLRRRHDAPMSVFLYVEPFEVRKEIVLRPRDLEDWVDLGIGDAATIPVDRQEELKRRVADFLSGHNPVTIDGQPAVGKLDRIHFVRRSLRRTGIVDPPEEMDTISATLGAIWVYPVDGLPDEVRLEWELFNERVAIVPSAATDEAGGLPFRLVPDDPVLVWQNFLTDPTIPGLIEVSLPPPRRNPWLAALGVIAAVGFVVVASRQGREIRRGKRASAAGWGTALLLAVVAAFSATGALRSSRVADTEAREIVTDLLTNVYGAFDYRDEERIYDTLARSVAGDLLTRIYLETRRSLEIENQGGARARVKDVEMIESDRQPLPGTRGFASHCVWNVSGSVGHWGHLHTRTNRYEARFVVEVVDGTWKLTDLELLQEERL